MAVAGVIPQARPRPGVSPLTVLRVATLLGILLLWQAVSVSGLIYNGVIPSLLAILRALVAMLFTAALWQNLWVTAYEVLGALLIGGATGLVSGLALGSSKFLARAYEPFIHYVGPTPKIVFLPVFLIAFGTGPGSKLALGAVSAFVPIALSIASGVRGVDPVFMRVAASFRLTRWQVVRMIYLPALVAPLSIGLRLAFGLAVVGCLLGELGLSNAGLGYMAGDFYNHFLIPQMYAVLVFIFILAACGNAAIVRLIRPRGLGARK
jgi:ABC-type nitrate/sulfonate/bicarbonate transport system permease component